MLRIRIHWIQFQDQDPDCFLSPDSAPVYFIHKTKTIDTVENVEIGT